MKNSILLSTLAGILGTVAACSSAPVEDSNDSTTTTATTDEARAALSRTAAADPVVMEQLALLRARRWEAAPWSEAHVEQVALPHAIAVEAGRDTLTRLSLPVVRFDAAGIANGHAHLLYAPGADGEARVAVRADDATSAAALSPDARPDPQLEVEAEEGDATESGTQLDCARAGGCSTAFIGPPVPPPSPRPVPTWTAHYISKVGTNFVCFDDGFNWFSQYYYLTGRTGPRNGQSSWYRSYSGCGVSCPWPNKARSLFVCGEIPHPGCTGL